MADADKTGEWRNAMLIKTDANWDKVTDVVIVGYGMAGAVSAITAHDYGAETLVIDKQAKENFRTNSSLSSGYFVSSSDVKKTAQYVDTLNRLNVDIPWTEPEITQVWAEYTADNAKWMQKLGAKLLPIKGIMAEHKEIPGSESFEGWQYAGSGPRMMPL